ncbi:cyanoexosortase A system-associated protein [Synechococcus sp. PCC 7502]|uniref:cyanoexosortase A system-associated protein n=1 Tax=Synechococcus sp. PCC 7502 TaxID=1173263 RepID=UPI00059D491A|nr:cyanoexosortase A system-associated protein [Synechococcus sp. PCC 7502]
MAAQSRIWYLGLLGGLTVGVLAIMGRSLIDPTWGRIQPPTIPDRIPIPAWSDLNSTPTSLTTRAWGTREIQAIPGRRYTYSQASQLPLALEVFYFQSPSGGVDSFLKLYAQSKKSKYEVPVMKIAQESGSSYGLYYNQNTAYLSSCINPRGGSTVTNEQFQANRDRYDLNPKRWIPVILGMERLRDWRCLWINLSIPSNMNNVDESYKTLVTAWQHIDSNRYQYFKGFANPD